MYVATPHSLHAENALAALAAGKHVLVEKAFTLNADQAREVAREAADRRLLVMEAMWTRFLPHMAFVREVAASGRLGKVCSVHADHTQKLSDDPAHRLNDLALGGGALLDLGVYPLSFAHDLLGPVAEVSASATMRETGVDADVATTLRHVGGGLSTSFSSSRTRGRNVARSSAPRGGSTSRRCGTPPPSWWSGTEGPGGRPVREPRQRPGHAVPSRGGRARAGGRRAAQSAPHARRHGRRHGGHGPGPSRHRAALPGE